MKRLPAIFFLFFLGALLATPILSQEPDFDRAYQDYLHDYNQYRESHTAYTVAKNQYLTYQTLTAKNTALLKTREMLEKRAQALRTYLAALRLKLAEVTEVIGYRANVLYLNLDKETNWLRIHQDSLSSAATLEDLLVLSQDFESRYPKTEVLIYQALGEILQSKEINLYQQLKEIVEAIKAKIQIIKETDREEALTWERWLLEAENKMVRSLEKRQQAKAVFQLLEPDEELAESFHQGQFALKEANQYLKEVVFNLKEIIREIKYE